MTCECEKEKDDRIRVCTRLTQTAHSVNKTAAAHREAIKSESVCVRVCKREQSEHVQCIYQDRATRNFISAKFLSFYLRLSYTGQMFRLCLFLTDVFTRPQICELGSVTKNIKALEAIQLKLLAADIKGPSASDQSLKKSGVLDGRLYGSYSYSVSSL